MKKFKMPIIENITNDIINSLIQRHSVEKARVNNLKYYYDNHNEILNRTMNDETKPNNKLSHPYCAFITNLITGHFMGIPITYKSEDDELLTKLTDINNINDEQDTNSTIAEWQSICGYGVELIYSDENAIPRFVSVNPADMIIVYDDTIAENIQFAIRYFKIDSIGESDIQKIKVEVYTKDTVNHYVKEEEVFRLIDSYNNVFLDVPICVYANNNDMVGDYEKVISIINAYDKTESDTANDFEYFTDAYLKIIGVEVDAETVNELKEKRVLNFPDVGADASFLTKQMNDTALENYKKRLNEDIHKFSFVPDVSSANFTSSISGEALKFKFAALNNICKTKQNKFKKGLMRRIKLICNFLKIKDNTNYNFIIPVFTLNMPKNETDTANMVKNLWGLVSKETLLAQLQMVDDVKFEFERIDKESKDEFNDYDFNKPDVGDDPIEQK